MVRKSRSSNKVKLCIKCGNQKLIYSPGIDIGLFYASCLNCGYKANSVLFPDIDKKKAEKIKVIKGERLDKLLSQNKSWGKTSLLLTVLVAIVFVVMLILLAFR